MDYFCIKNSSSYLKLLSNGKIVPCKKEERGVFTESKAKNIVNNMPKALKNLNYKIEKIVDEVQNIENIIQNERLHEWVDKFAQCENVFEEARDRYSELSKELSNMDKELIDLLHITELDPNKDLFSGWKIYKMIQKNRQARRRIKDEMLILHNILGKVDSKNFSKKNMEKAINGLLSRKYRFRIIEDEENDA